MDAKIVIAHIEIDNRKHKIRKHKENKQDEFEKRAQDIFLSKMKEFEKQEQEIKKRKTQESLACKKFWERQIEEKKLLRDLDKLQEKQLEERLNKYNELKQRRVREEPLTKQALVYEPLSEVNIEQVLKAALRNEQIRVRVENAKREAEEARRRRDDELRAARTKRMSEDALKISQAKYAKTKRQLEKEKQEPWEKAPGWALREPAGSLAPRAVAPPHTKTRMPTTVTWTHTKVKPHSRTDDFEPSFNMSMYNLHITYSYY